MIEAPSTRKASLFDWYSTVLWLLVLVPAAIVFRDWLFSLKTIAYADFTYYAPQTMADLWPPRMGWNGRDVVGSSTAASLPYFLLDLVIGIASQAHISFAVCERLLFFVPALIACIVGPYALTAYLTKSSVAGIVASGAALFSGYWLSVAAIGQVTLLAAQGLFPLFVLLFVKLMRDVTFARCAGMCAVLAAMTAYDLRFAYVALLVGLLLCGGYVALRGIRSVARPLLAIAGSWVAALGLIHAAWVLPSLYYHKLEPALPTGFDARGWLDALSYFTLPEALTQYHAWVMPVYGVAHPPALIYVLIFAAVLVPLVLRPREPWVIAFTFLMVVFAFLMKGAREPFAELNVWIFQHIPGMYGFRDPGKFAMVIVCTQATLLGYGIVLLGRKLPRLAYVLPVAAIALVLVAHWYIFSPTIGGSLRSRDVPSEYAALANFITDDREFSRVLWMPRRALFNVRTLVHPMVEPLSENPSALYGYTLDADDNASWPLGWLEQPYTGWLMRDLDVKYVVVPDGEIDEQVFRYGKTPRARIISLLSRAPWARFDRRIGGIDVYRVRDPYELITGSSAVVALVGGSAADLRHLKSAWLPEDAGGAPVLLNPINATPAPASERVVPQPAIVPKGRQVDSYMFYGGRVMVQRADGPRFSALVGSQRGEDTSIDLAAPRSFFPSDTKFLQPAPSRSSLVTLRVRLKPAPDVTRLAIVLFCGEAPDGTSCTDGYALEWERSAVRLIRYRYNKRTVLATLSAPLRDGTWHDISLSSRHPNRDMQQLVATVDGARMQATDSGDQIVYGGRIALILAGSSVRIDPAHTGIDGKGGDWIAPISIPSQIVLAKSGFALTQAERLFVAPIGAANPIGRVPILDDDVTGSGTKAPDAACSDLAQTVTPLRFEAPVFGTPLLSWRAVHAEQMPASIGLILRDGEGKTSCLAVPVLSNVGGVDVRSYLTFVLEGAFAESAALRKRDYGWRSTHQAPRLADDFVVTGLRIAAPQNRAAVHVTLSIDRAALASHVTFDPDAFRAHVTTHDPASACLAVAGDQRDDAHESILLWTRNREVAAEDIQHVEALLRRPSYSIGLSTPSSLADARGIVAGGRLQNAPATFHPTLASGECVFQSQMSVPSVLVDSRALRGMSSIGQGSHLIMAATAPLALRTAGVVLGTNALTQIRTVPVRFTQPEPLHFHVVISAAPAWIMFREGYDAGWVAKSGGRTLLHARANDLFNAYYVERPGEIDIEYAPRNLAIVGEIISTVSASLLLVYLAAYLWRRRR